jgi:hypothetical protein
MDLAYFHLWSAGYTLPATLPKPADKPMPVIQRRGKKAARAKRERVTK